MLTTVAEFEFTSISHGTDVDVSVLRTSGIYCIRNNVNGHCYIGSSNRVLVRGRRHYTQLMAGNHHCEPLQRAVAKYGIKVFSIGLCEKVDNTDMLRDTEQVWIDKFGYYNTAKQANSPAGIKMNLTDAERQRRRDRILAVNKSKTAQEISAAVKRATEVRLLNPTTEDTKIKISNSLKGRVFSDEHKQRIRVSKEANPENKIRNIESADRMNDMRRNRTAEQVEAWKAKLSDARKGKKLSDEHRAKIKAGMAARRANMILGE